MDKRITLGNFINATLLIAGFIWTIAQRDRDVTEIQKRHEVQDGRISMLEGKVEMLQLFNARLEPDIAYIKQTLNEVKSDVKVLNLKTPNRSSEGGQ